MKDAVLTPSAELDSQIALAQTAVSQATVKTGLWWSTESAMTMSAAVLLFGVFTMIIAAVLIRKGTPPEATLRVVGTLIILVASVFLVVAGYDDKQIAPVMGLLGTVAGYLLGKSTRDS